MQLISNANSSKLQPLFVHFVDVMVVKYLMNLFILLTGSRFQFQPTDWFIEKQGM